MLLRITPVASIRVDYDRKLAERTGEFVTDEMGFEKYVLEPLISFREKWQNFSERHFAELQRSLGNVEDLTYRRLVLQFYNPRRYGKWLSEFNYFYEKGELPSDILEGMVDGLGTISYNFAEVMLPSKRAFRKYKKFLPSIHYSDYYELIPRLAVHELKHTFGLQGCRSDSLGIYYPTPGVIAKFCVAEERGDIDMDGFAFLDLIPQKSWVRKFIEGFKKQELCGECKKYIHNKMKEDERVSSF